MDVEFGEIGATEVVGRYSADVFRFRTSASTPELVVDASTTYRLRFRSTTGGASGVYLDNVQLVPIPEPTTLTFLGLGSLGLVMARRRW